MSTRKLEDYATLHEGILEVNFNPASGWYINIYCKNRPGKTYVGKPTKYKADSIEAAEEHIKQHA